MKKLKTLISTLLFTIAMLSQTTQAADYTNPIGMKFKNIPAGSFYMGSCTLSAADKEKNKKRLFMGLPAKGVSCPSGESTDNEASESEVPQHKVHITNGFQIGIYEVTLGQLKKFIVGGDRDDLLTDDFIKNNSHGDNAAVTTISWNDVQDFIHWLNKKEGGNAYRLPTEAEWEYAARAGTTTKYSWGNSIEQADTYAWYEKNASHVGSRYAHTVGGKKPNPWGLYDMHGNVLEWVQDWYNKNYYRNSPTNDPKGASSGRFHVMRGGSWGTGQVGSLRSTHRNAYKPNGRDHGLGFRLVRQP